MHFACFGLNLPRNNPTNPGLCHFEVDAARRVLRSIIPSKGIGSIVRPGFMPQLATSRGPDSRSLAMCDLTETWRRVSRNPKPNGGVIHSENSEKTKDRTSTFSCAVRWHGEDCGETWMVMLRGIWGRGPEVAEAIFASTACSGCGVLSIGH